MTLFTKLPYDVLKNFTQVSVIASFEMLLAVPDSSPYKSIKDVVEAARKNPGKLNLGAVNPGQHAESFGAPVPAGDRRRFHDHPVSHHA